MTEKADAVVQSNEKNDEIARSRTRQLLGLSSGAVVWLAVLCFAGSQAVRQVSRLAQWFDQPLLRDILYPLRDAPLRLPFWLLVLLFPVFAGWIWLAGKCLCRRNGQKSRKRLWKAFAVTLLSFLLTVSGLSAVIALTRVHDIPVLAAIRAFRVLLPALSHYPDQMSSPVYQPVLSSTPVWLERSTCFSRGSGWLAGYAQVEIAIDLTTGGPYYIAGYRNDHPATGVLDPQKAHAVYLDDQSGQGGVLLLSLDCIGLSSADVAIVRESLKPLSTKTNIRVIHVLASHTHAGVDTLGLWGPVGIGGKNTVFMEMLYEAAQTAAQNAYANSKAGRLYFGTVEIPDLQQDSRLPHIFSRTLSVFRFAPDDGSPGFRLVNFAAHAEALRSENTLISADFPFYLAEGIRKGSGDNTFFTAGAIGGLIMTRRLKDDSGRDLPVVKNVQATGQLLADAALSIQNETEVDPSLLTASAGVRIDLDNPVFVALRFLGVISTQAVQGGGSYSLAVETTVSLLAFGGQRILLIPGELFPELVYGSDFSGANPASANPPPLMDLLGDDLIVFGLSDDEIGYVVPPNDFLLDEQQPYIRKAIDAMGRSHYEETNAVGINAAWGIFRAVERLAAEMDEACTR